MQKPNTPQNAPQSGATTSRPDHTFEVLKTTLKQFNDGEVVYCNLLMDGHIYLYDCRVVETEHGDFVSLPKRKGADGKYYSQGVFIKFTNSEQKTLIDLIQASVMNGR